MLKNYNFIFTDNTDVADPTKKEKYLTEIF